MFPFNLSKMTDSMHGSTIGAAKESNSDAKTLIEAKSSEKVIAALPIRTSPTGIKRRNGTNSTKGDSALPEIRDNKIEAKDPFLRPNLRKAAFNYVEDGIAEVPCSQECKGDLEPITNGTLSYENAPAVFIDEMSLALPRFSHLYSIKPEPKEMMMWEIFNQIRKMLMNKFPSESLPMVYLYRDKSEQSKPMAILLQCLDEESHLRLEAEGTALDFGKEEKLGVEKSGITYTMILKHSGLRVNPHICTVAFSAEFEFAQPMLPVDHEVVLRVAKRYAKLCGCSAPTEDYPNAPNGLLQVWRDTLKEYNLIQRSRVVSDLNDFQMSFWIPHQGARKNLLSSYVDDVTKQKFTFEFPVFKTTVDVKDTAGKNRLIDWHPSHEIECKWPGQFTRCTF